MTTESEFKNHVGKCKKVIQKFGTTRKYECTGFILPDGKQINFCKKGKPWLEHYTVGTAYKNIAGIHDGVDEMERYMADCHAVRFRKHYCSTGKVVRAHAIQKPNEKQIMKIIHSLTPEVDRFHGYKETEKVHIACELEADHPRGLDVRRWIHKCWR